MRLTYRSAKPEDIAVCFERLGATFAYEPQLRPHVPYIWRRLLADGLMATTVIEDHDRPPECRIVGFGASAFVSDAFIKQVRRSKQPYARAQLLRNILAGDSPILTLAEARQANVQEGLNLFFLNDVLSNRTLTIDELRCVHGAWSEPLYALRACRIKEIVWECYGEEPYCWARACGLLHRTAWNDVWTTQAVTPPSHERPYLVGITRTEALAQPGTHATFVFHHYPSRFVFTAGQQELLAHALAGATDDELARVLSLSVSAVKKRWLAIYQRVEQYAPDIMAANVDVSVKTGSGPEQKRGAEKRRHVLNYVRHHPEELHPVNAAKE